MVMMINSVVRNLMPRGGHDVLRRLHRRLNAWLYQGERFHCPVCDGRFRAFKPFGVEVAVARDLRMVALGRRDVSICPGCVSKERDRAIALYLTLRRDWFRQGSRAILHIAPEEGLGRYLRMLPNVSYLSGDLCPEDSPTPAMRRIDVTQIPFEAGTFDLIVCSHVMEHVADDRQAMCEVLRVLKEGGGAFLQVPYSPVLKETREDITVTEDADRLRLYGQKDHVRLYGTDYAERLRAVGFTVAVCETVDLFGEDIACKHGLTLEENLFVCSKGPSAFTQTDGVK
jgi:SAM-dependent methyltransferase